MRSAFSAKSIALLFGAVLLLYFAAFYGCEHVRARKGPWEVQFHTDGDGRPSVVIYQPRLGISAVEILFVDEQHPATNLTERVNFSSPQMPVPFGEVIYEDLTFLPGVVTFNLFGHEVELLRRVLIVNKKEIAWTSDSTVELAKADKPANPPKPPHKR
jgi:hypothetical protein